MLSIMIYPLESTTVHNTQHMGGLAGGVIAGCCCHRNDSG